MARHRTTRSPSNPVIHPFNALTCECTQGSCHPRVDLNVKVSDTTHIQSNVLAFVGCYMFPKEDLSEKNKMEARELVRIPLISSPISSDYGWTSRMIFLSDMTFTYVMDNPNECDRGDRPCSGAFPLCTVHNRRYCVVGEDPATCVHYHNKSMNRIHYTNIIARYDY